ncbi:hypothetical protein M513_13176 [Trichuris suis]|uniref:Uncharacterized protein n=1 Tax=Trichuris suis TaxID=68888 RepID=A0A085LLU2_9BILA|nr:hypothetical protein M513_13176 [Trichuris suis]
MWDISAGNRRFLRESSLKPIKFWLEIFGSAEIDCSVDRSTKTSTHYRTWVMRLEVEPPLIKNSIRTAGQDLPDLKLPILRLGWCRIPLGWRRAIAEGSPGINSFIRDELVLFLLNMEQIFESSLVLFYFYSFLGARKAPVRRQKQTRMDVNEPLDVSQLVRFRRRTQEIFRNCSCSVVSELGERGRRNKAVPKPLNSSPRGELLR